MTKASQKAYHENQPHFKSDKAKILWLIQKKPRVTGKDLEKFMGKTFSKFSGRLTELMADGLIYVLDEGQFSQYVYERDKGRQEELRMMYERDYLLKRIENFVKQFEGRFLTEEGRKSLRTMWLRVKSELTPTERLDRITQKLID